MDVLVTSTELSENLASFQKIKCFHKISNFGTFRWFLAKTADTVTVLNLMQYLCISHACRYKLNILLSTLLNHLLRYVTGQCDAMVFKSLWNRIQMIFFKFFVYQKMFWCLSDLQSFVQKYCRQTFFMHKILNYTAIFRSE